MKKIIGFAVGVILCLPLVGITANLDAAHYNLGEFVVDLAGTLNVDSEGDLDAEAAIAALKNAGVEIDGDLDSELTEAAVVDALNQLGLNLTTSIPDGTVSQATANQLLANFGLKDGAQFSRTEATKTKTKKPKASPKD